MAPDFIRAFIKRSRNPAKAYGHFRALLERPGLTVEKLYRALEIVELWEELRGSNFLSVEGGRRDRGAGHFVNLQKEVGGYARRFYGDTLLKALRTALELSRE